MNVGLIGALNIPPEIVVACCSEVEVVGLDILRDSVR